jgi:hypothetical protein
MTWRGFIETILNTKQIWRYSCPTHTEPIHGYLKIKSSFATMERSQFHAGLWTGSNCKPMTNEKCGHDDISFNIGGVQMQSSVMRKMSLSGICNVCLEPVTFIAGDMLTIAVDQADLYFVIGDDAVKALNLKRAFSQ